MASEKTKEELAFDGGRISLTFRSIGTFLDKDQQKIWGQGAISKAKDKARMVMNGNSVESEKMIRAFGKENHASDFDWDKWYGEGFDVLHISNTPKLFLSGDFVEDIRVKILLAEFGVPWSEASISPSFNWRSGDTSSTSESPIPSSLPVTFVDNDLSRSTTSGDLAIVFYLASIYGAVLIPKSQAELARMLTRVQQSIEMLRLHRASPRNTDSLIRELKVWEAYAEQGPYIAGENISLADFALWPILHEIQDDLRGQNGLRALLAYYERLKDRESIAKAMGGETEKKIDATSESTGKGT
jgi:glutathione S-transferase